MARDPRIAETDDLLERIRDLERRLDEADETLGAIRRGEIDAVVVSNQPGQHRVYTLESADRPYQIMVEQMQEGAVTLRADGTVVYCNHRLATMLRVPQERMIGQGLQRFMLADCVTSFASLLNDAKRAGGRRELTMRTSDGQTVPVYVSLNAMHDDHTTLLCGVVTDLTAQKVHLQELAEANARLSTEIAERERVEGALRQAQKMEAIGQLTGGIAHDFNNMLQGIIGGISLAKRRIVSGHAEDAPKMLEGAEMAADRAATLTRRLLGFSRRQALNPKLLELGDLIAGMEGLIQRTVGPAVKVDVQLKDRCWPVRCDPNQLENALLNLAINARDALMPKGGRLVIKTTHRVLDQADVDGWEGATPGDYVCVSVADNGIGMPPDVLAHAFEPFFTTKPDGQGTGLGLSQLYGFVQQSDGAIRLESEVGVGTTVHIYLPRGHEEPTDARSAAPTERQQKPRADATPATILLVEDEPLIRDIVADALQARGYRVIEAADGPAGLRALRETLQTPNAGKVGLLVTDVGLPGGLNGRQMADAARELMPRLPVLLITGYGGDAINDERLAPGMDVLAKPFSLEALTERVQAMTGETLPGSGADGSGRTPTLYADPHIRRRD